MTMQEKNIRISNRIAMMGPWFYKMISILPGLTSVKWQTKLILAKVNVV
jgi:hypothetical protein